MNSITSIFNINSEKEFNTVSLEIFNFQWTNNPIYQQFCNYLKINPQEIKSIEQIPFLPIEFFKSHPIKTGIFEPEQVFLSSGTTGMTPSKHFVKAIELYEISFTKAFQQFYGNIEDYCVLALLPSYLEREGSSLVYMVEQLI
ncbi:MAG: acyl transferase, partial [Flavobacteriales bacterium]|nr:acyl transferase [Flavobacteriales bacterium]